MKNQKIVIPIIIITAIVGVIAVSLDQEKYEEKIGIDWIHSGPFSIEKQEYYLGEKIFIIVQNIPKDVSGNMVFYRTANISHAEESDEISRDRNGVKYIEIEFDGENKQNFNRYFEPRLNELKGICSRDDLIGEWKVVFEGTQYEDIDFRILNQTSSWDERTFEPIVGTSRC